ncbi:hypothetical protein [Pengzhenrongella sp.]|uniref:hypothetical protein n=1 Tax=Pengzhenrongella sp. TaxID=2888820 RepID=UPI002F95FF09
MNRRTRASSAAVAVLVTASLLGGCAAPDLTGDVATRLQADVLAVSRASAGGNVPLARTALATLTRHVAAARRNGELSVERQDLIESSITEVSADLTALERQRAQAQAAEQARADEAAAAAAAAAAEEQAGPTPKDGPSPGKHRKHKD